jgi:cysteinyl-tRNA synthetase
MVKQPEKSQAVYEAAVEIDTVLGLSLDSIPQKETGADLPGEVQALAERRRAAKAEKNWSEADRLRNEIKDMGYEVKDTKEGEIITPV